MNKENKSIKIIKKNIPTAELFIKVIDDNMHISKHFWYQPKDYERSLFCWRKEVMISRRIKHKNLDTINKSFKEDFVPNRWRHQKYPSNDVRCIFLTEEGSTERGQSLSGSSGKDDWQEKWWRRHLYFCSGESQLS